MVLLALHRPERVLGGFRAEIEIRRQSPRSFAPWRPEAKSRSGGARIVDERSGVTNCSATISLRRASALRSEKFGDVAALGAQTEQLCIVKTRMWAFLSTDVGEKVHRVKRTQIAPTSALSRSSSSGAGDCIVTPVRAAHEKAFSFQWGFLRPHLPTSN
jgi:hypothetical protein